MICLRVTFTVHPGAESECERFLRAMIENSLKEAGCRAYAGWRSREHPRRFFIYEVYDDEDALQAHRRAPYFEQNVTNGLARLMESVKREFYVPV